MTTGDRLIEAAAALLDSGGEASVTLRAVAQAVGVSHNAPYRHFADRAALLAAVAERDFVVFTDTFNTIQGSDRPAMAKVREALSALVAYGERFPARYRLLFSDPNIASRGGTLEQAAMTTFTAFSRIIAEAQASKDLPSLPALKVAGLMYGAVHGLIDLQAGGRLRAEKGLSTAAEGVETLIELLSASSRRRSGDPVAA